MAYAPPNYGPPQFATRPVNFGDHNEDPRGRFPAHSSQSPDAATTLTGYTSGISVPYSEYLNDQGETRAQEVASEYARRNTDDHPQTTPNSAIAEKWQRDPQAADRNSNGMQSVDALTYIDEDFNYYSSKRRRNSAMDHPTAPLVTNAELPSGSKRQDLEYADPYQQQKQPRAGILGKLLGSASGRYPLEQQIENKRRGVVRQRRPYVVWFLTAVMVAVMVYEIIQNYRVTGAPFAFKPFVNPMLGPAQIELITLGARWPPCMKTVEAIPLTLPIACANTTSLPATNFCSIEDICAFGGFQGKEPNQWWRFFTAIFIHAGLVHLALNMLGQWSLCGQVEQEMGSPSFLLLYFAAGIFGNILGGNFALVGIPSVGASGAICGTLAAMWVDLFAHWNIEYKPVRKLIVHIIQLAILIGVGFIPGVDNFAHLGGLLMGLVFAILLYPVISTTKRHQVIMWGLRIAMIPLAIILFVVLIRNFYTGDPSAACSWCRYLSCIPSSSNNYCKGTGLTTTTTTTN